MRVLTATSTGRRDASIAWRSITTEVSSSPRAGRGRSATRCGVLAGRSVEVIPETSEVDSRRCAEQRDGGLGWDEPVSPQRSELTDRDAVAGHDERLAFVEPTHDLAAVVAEFPLGDLSAHAPTVARRATSPRSCERCRYSRSLPRRSSPSKRSREDRSARPSALSTMGSGTTRASTPPPSSHRGVAVRARPRSLRRNSATGPRTGARRDLGCKMVAVEALTTPMAPSEAPTGHETPGHRLVHLALHNTNLSPLVEGPVISVSPRYAKVRRNGYRGRDTTS